MAQAGIGDPYESRAIEPTPHLTRRSSGQGIPGLSGGARGCSIHPGVGNQLLHALLPPARSRGGGDAHERFLNHVPPVLVLAETRNQNRVVEQRRQNDLLRILPAHRSMRFFHMLKDFDHILLPMAEAVRAFVGRYQFFPESRDRDPGTVEDPPP